MPYIYCGCDPVAITPIMTATQDDKFLSEHFLSPLNLITEFNFSI